MAVLSGAMLLAAVVALGRFMTLMWAAYFAFGVLFSLVMHAIALTVVKRRPGNVVGPLLSWFAFNIPFFITRDIYWWVVDSRAPELWSNWANALIWETGLWVDVNLGLLMLFFPDGKLPSRRWRWVPPAMVGGMILVQLVGVAVPSTYDQIDRLPEPLLALPETFVTVAGPAGFATVMLLLIASGASLFVKFRHSEGIRRAQLKWMAFVGLLLPAALVGCWLEYLIVGRVSVFTLGAWAAVYVGVPVAAGIAMLRHDLYDVDKAVAATITYGTVTVLLVGIYTATSFAAGVVLGRESPVVAAGATALCAAALSPLRTRLKLRVDRRFYPLRQAAMSAIDDLHQRIHSGDALPEQLQEELRSALRDPELVLGFLVPGTGRYLDLSGNPINPDKGIPVLLGSLEVGVLAPGSGSASLELLRQVAARSAVLVEMVRLRFELSAALREVESSRARLVQAGDRERQRLERDLHDGAQQRLVSLGMALRLAQRHLPDGTVEVNGLLDQSVTELATAVSELRQIAHGLRPSSLDEGLSAALATLTKTLPVSIEVDQSVDQLSEEVAVTAYFVASEAVSNAVKHAEAQRIGVSVARQDGQLSVRVEDDGCGGAVLSRGSGLSGLSDRVAAVGGTLSVDSRLGAGTVIEARLPCG